MRPFTVLAALVLTGLLWIGGARDAGAADGPYANWAAIFVAGDSHAHSGKPSEVFDNARKDLASAFQKAGFDPRNMAQFSVHPDQYRGVQIYQTDAETIRAQLDRLARQAKDGCLVYMTSHGNPTGMVLGDSLFTPAGLDSIVSEACGDRPTVVVVAACFSGIFVPTMASPNRMIVTAARADRTSFGCGEADHYTFFDTCMLASLPHAHDFAGLASAVQGCVAKRELDLGVGPPSEPQLAIGPQLGPILPLYAFASP